MVVQLGTGKKRDNSFALLGHRKTVHHYCKPRIPQNSIIYNIIFLLLFTICLRNSLYTYVIHYLNVEDGTYNKNGVTSNIKNIFR